MRIYTIGFTKTTAAIFFGIIKSHKIKKLIDVRLNNNSQLSGFAKKPDLQFFLREICKCSYEHQLALAPTPGMLASYRKNGVWTSYEKKFIQLMRTRKIEKLFQPNEMHRSCLLCSEDKPHFCHRRLVAEYLREKWGNTEIIHLDTD